MPEDTTLSRSVPHHTGNEGAANTKNLKAVRAALEAARAQADQARVSGDEALLALINGEISRLEGEITTLNTTLVAAIDQVDNRLTNHIGTYTDKMAQLDAAIEIANGLSEGERTAIMTIVEQAAVDIMESGKLEQIAARLSVMLNGVNVAIPDAIKALWDIPVLRHTEVLSTDADGYATATKLTFMDGRTATTTMIKTNPTPNVDQLDYTVGNFLGLGIDATATDKFTTGADDLVSLTQKGELGFTLSVSGGAAITVAAPDIDGDGQTEALGEGVQ